LSKRGEFAVLLVQLGLVGFSRVSRVSKVRVGIRVSVRIRVSLVLFIFIHYNGSEKCINYNYKNLTKQTKEK